MDEYILKEDGIENMMEIREKIKDILIENLELSIEKNEIEGEDLINELGINSVDAISIFISIEDMFNITIEDEDLNASLLSSLDNIVNYIYQKAK